MCIKTVGIEKGWQVAKDPLGGVVILTCVARSTSVCSDGGWMSRITGVDASGKYVREFCCGRKGSGKYRLSADGVYEYREICDGAPGDFSNNYRYKKYGGEAGFLMLDGETLTKITETELRQYLARQRVQHGTSTSAVETPLRRRICLRSSVPEFGETGLGHPRPSDVQASPVARIAGEGVGAILGGFGRCQKATSRLRKLKAVGCGVRAP